jgi:excisionase family DNA binding protein
MTGKQYLRATQIAAITGASIRTVRRWIAGELLPSVRIGGTRLVAEADLDRLLAPSRSNAHPHPAEAE